MTIELTVILAVFTVLNIVLGLVRNTKSDTKRDASELTTVIVKLETISSGVSEIKSDMRAMQQRADDFNERIVVLEQSEKTQWLRIDELRNDYKALSAALNNIA